MDDRMIPLSVLREYMPKLKDEDLKELGPVEYDQSKVPEVSKKHAENVRRKAYLPDMTESFARGVEYAGLMSSEASNVARTADLLSKDTQNRFKDQIEGTTNSEEVIDARRPSGQDTFRTLGDRLDTELDIAQKTYFMLRPNGIDDTVNLIIALQNFDRITLSGTYYINVDIAVDNKTLIGNHAIFRPVNGVGLPLKIRGNNNRIEGIEASTESNFVVEVEGDHNVILNNRIYRPSRLTTTSPIYNPLLHVKGSFNEIKNNECFNGGCGITVSDGTSNMVVDNEVHDNTMGIRNVPSARKTTIRDNDVYSNDVAYGSGADGILIHRNSTGAIIENNRVSGSGEHGMYVQGDNTIIRGNMVNNNAVDGIKMGSHESDLYNHEGLYHLNTNIIDANICCDNGSNGIYLQTPYENINIGSNQCFGNGEEGIKVVYISSERFYADTLKIINNIAQSMDITAFKNCVIDNNDIKGTLRVSGWGTAETAAILNPFITNNNAAKVYVYRSKNPKFVNNTIKEKFEITGNPAYTKAVLKSNDITVIDGNFDISYIDVLNDNNIVLKTGILSLSSSAFPENIDNNKLSLEGLSDGSQMIEYKWMTQNNGKMTRITRNTFKINKGKFFDLFNSTAIVTDNYFLGGTADEAIIFRGENLVFTGNISDTDNYIGANATGDIKGVVSGNRMEVRISQLLSLKVTDNF